MVKSFIRHQQSKQLTSCMFYFSTIPVGFMQKEKKKTFSFFDLFSFYVDLLFAAVADVCAFI